MVLSQYQNFNNRTTRLIIAATATFTVLPHVFHLSALPIGLVSIFISLHFIQIYTDKTQTPKVLFTLCAIGSTAAVLASYGTFSGKTAGTALLVILFSLKLLEIRRYRDAMVAIFLAYTVSAMQLLFSQSLPTMLWMLAQIVLITSCLFTIHRDQTRSAFKQNLQLSLQITLQALPIMLILFFFFPRIPGPLWGDAGARDTAVTGFSSTMSPGQISQLVKSGNTAFRVDFKNQTPNTQSLYWRGLVLTTHDGTQWQRQTNPAQQEHTQPYQPDNTDSIVEYTIILEPHQEKVLFTLERPFAFSGKAILDTDNQLLTQNPIYQTYIYQATSDLKHTTHPDAPIDLKQNLQLPDHYNPKTIALGRQWRQQIVSSEAIIKHALQFFNQKNFFYTLTPINLGEHYIDDFLFSTRQGFCEHYASAFVTLMRAAGIPARVVVGYQGGNINPVDQLLTVRQSDAHAWAEVWIADKGWQRIDPTAAVAPERVTVGLEAALPESEGVLLSALKRQWLQQYLSNVRETFNTYWNHWVLGYGPQMQKQLMEKIGLENLYQLIYMMVGLLLLSVAILVYMILKPDWRHPPDPIQQRYKRFCQRMQKWGYPHLPHQTATDYCQQLAKYMPHNSGRLNTIAITYNALRYGQYNKTQLAQLDRLINDLRRHPNKTGERLANDFLAKG